MRLIKEPKELIEQLPATGFPEYLKSFNGCIDYWYLVEGNCILPFTIRKRSIFKYIQLTTPVIGVKTNSEEKEFLNKAITYLKKHVKVDYLTSTGSSIFNTYPNSSLYCKFGTYIIDLKQTEDELFAALHSKHRNVIRKAYKDGLVVLSGKKYMPDCYSLIKKTFDRQGLMAPTLETIKKLEYLRDNISYTIVTKDKQIQGCAILLWSTNKTCFYLHGGSSDAPHSGAMNLLHWESMIRMKNKGVNYYDFVGGRINPDKGSKLEGIQRFKSRFGGEFKMGYIWKYTFNRKKYIFYSLLMKIYFRLRYRIAFEGDTIDQERTKGNY